MAATEQIVYTPVPNGISPFLAPGPSQGAPALNISIHVAPTLSGGATGTLQDFPDFWNWPQTVITLNDPFQVTFTDAGKTTTRKGTATIDTSALNPALWTALFSPPASIKYAARDAAEPYTTTPVVSYPSDQIASFLETTYTALATGSPTSYPSTQTLGGIYGGIGYGNQDVLSRLRSIWNGLSAARLSPPVTHAGPAPYANDWSGASIETAMAALRFYHMPASRLAHVPKPSLPTVDFHRALTFISDHRQLQRALGLVFDVQIPITGRLPAAFGGSSVSNNVYVSALLADAGNVGLTNSSPIEPRVQCNASNSVWEASPATTQIVGRQLTLGDSSSFAVYEIDVDGGGLKTAQFADNLQLATFPQSAAGGSGAGAAPDAPTSYAPPSLRSAGLTVAAVNRGLEFVATLQRGSSLLAGAAASPPSVPDLTAEDLVRGYVLDVYDAPGKAWSSTASRDVVYSLSPAVAGTPITVTDEPGLDTPPRSQTDPTNPSQSQLNLPANIIRWTGWSNTAPRPGAPLAQDGSNTVNSAGAGSGPFSQLAVGGPGGAGAPTPTPGSLPRLRFGTQYALRARVVDIAGNVIPLAGGAQLGDASKRVTPLSVYGRHEPIGSPDIYTWNQPLPGESLKHLVIRDIDASPSSVRAVAPNRVAEAFAELHGVFDTGALGALDGSSTTYNLIATREDTRYPLSATKTSSGSPLWNPITLTAPVPFLPDPLARGGTLYVTTGPLAGKNYRFDFNPAAGQPWPAYQPYGIALVPGANQAVTLDNAARQLSFALSKGDTVLAQLSSYVNSGDLVTLGMYQWISRSYGGSVPAGFQQAVTSGLTWAMTPYTTIELIYAVQVPLLVASFASFSALKQLGWTYAQLFGDITYSPKSTAHTDLLAAWGEPVDNGPGTGVPQGPGSPKKALAPRRSTVFTIPSSGNQQTSEQDRFEGRHEFFDTKHRVVGYTGKATSRFTEHYHGQTTVKVPSPGTATAAITLPGKANLGLEPGSVVVSSGATIYQENTAFKVDGPNGTITFLAPPAGPPTGATVSVDFLPTVSVESPVTTLKILSSARPLAPAIEFIVPIYKWSKIHRKGKETVSERSPSAVRVFLKRPWWSSGIGELLGVTTYPSAENKDIDAAIPGPASRYVSDWGLDPVFRGHALPSPHPRLESFRKRVATGTGLTLDETAAVKVNVAGHDVFYDAERDLWYADIEVAIGKAYTPMVRLALARYQPASVPGAELSRVVLADVISLEPGRAAVVVRKSPTLLESVTVGGYSYSHDGDLDGNGPGVATLVVEARNEQVDDEVIGWEPVGKPVAMAGHTSKGFTTWSARNVALPGPLGRVKHRLWIGQYEVIPQDTRATEIYTSFFRDEGLRLLYQDIIPLG